MNLFNKFVKENKLDIINVVKRIKNKDKEISILRIDNSFNNSGDVSNIQFINQSVKIEINNIITNSNDINLNDITNRLDNSRDESAPPNSPGADSAKRFIKSRRFSSLKDKLFDLNLDGSGSFESRRHSNEFSHFDLKNADGFLNSYEKVLHTDTGNISGYLDEAKESEGTIIRKKEYDYTINETEEDDEELLTMKTLETTANNEIRFNDDIINNLHFKTSKKRLFLRHHTKDKSKNIKSNSIIN